jgi:hypothetical protein
MSVPTFFRAGPSLKVLKSRPERYDPDDDVFTIRVFLSGVVLAVAMRVGRSNFVK